MPSRAEEMGPVPGWQGSLMSETRDLEERVAALEAAMAVLMGPEPDFMDRVRIDVLDSTPDGTVILTVRLTHEPTGVMVVARDRAEGVFKLRKALTARARREYDLQEQQRRAGRKAAREAGGIPGAP